MLAIAFGAAVLLLQPAAASARTVKLLNSQGCDTFEVQKDRLGAVNIAYTATMMRSKGQQTEDSEKMRNFATQHLVQLTKEHCHELTGHYKVLSERDGMVRVQTSEFGPLWSLGE